MRLRELLWQVAIDWWSLAHCWGWAAATYLVVKWTSRLRFAFAIDEGAEAVQRWRIRVLDRPTALVLLAVLIGIGWEAVETAWVEPLLGFREPPWNKVVDVLVDALGAWMGMTMAAERGKFLTSGRPAPYT